MKFDKVSNRVIGCALEVHRVLGPGLLESSYQHCLSHELEIKEISHQCEYPLPINYKGVEIDCGYRIDIMIENNLIVELKSVDTILGIHEAQILTYMKLANVSVGLLINFNVELLKDGIRRFVR